MSERPLLMQGDMVRATLDERKTNTRRVINPQPVNEQKDVPWGWAWRKNKKRWFAGVTEAQMRA